MNLSVSDITKHLEKKLNIFDIEIFDNLASTNVTLKELAASDIPEGKVIIAERQSAGHGRFDRPFFSPAGTGIYMSLLLRPNILPTDTPLITTCAAVAVAKALDDVTGNYAQIKWINDIFINNRKVCGILTEASFSALNSFPKYAVLGIGINVFEPEGGFPAELSDIASSAIFAHSADSDSSSALLTREYKNSVRGEIIARVLNNFMHYYPALGSREFLTEYRNRSLVLGQNIRIMDTPTGTPAKAIAIDDNCNLIVELGDKSTRTLNSGEISIRLK